MEAYPNLKVIGALAFWNYESGRFARRQEDMIA
jgi:hypothetical protein